MGESIEDQIEELCRENDRVRELLQDRLEKRQNGFMMTRDEMEKINFQLTALEILLRSVYQIRMNAVRDIAEHFQTFSYKDDPRLSDAQIALSTVDAAYDTYRLTNKLADTPISRMSYYLHVSRENQKDPYPDADVQWVVRKRIDERVKQASREADDYFNRIVERQGPKADRD